MLGYVYTQLERKEEALLECRKASELEPDISSFSNYWLIQIYIKTGEYDKAIERIKKQLAVSNMNLLWGITRWRLILDPWYDPLRDDPRFQKLVE